MDDPKLATTLDNLPDNILDRMTAFELRLEELERRPGLQIEEITEGRLTVSDLTIFPDEGVTVTEPTDTGYSGGFICGEGLDFGGTIYTLGYVKQGVIQWGGQKTLAKLLAGGGNWYVDVDGQTLLAGVAETLGATIRWMRNGVLYGDITVKEPDPGDVKVYIRGYDSNGVNKTQIVLNSDGTIDLAGKVEATGLVTAAAGIDVTNGHVRSLVVTLADDTATSFTPTKNTGIIKIGTSSSNDYVEAFYNVTTGTIAAGPISANTVVGSGALTDGTTDGTDTKLNVYAHTDGKIYIKNRRGVGAGRTVFVQLY